MLCDPVLAFIKAFRLRGSSSNLKLAALSKFDSVVMCKAKKALWDSDCSSLLTVAGLSYQQRRGSEKRCRRTGCPPLKLSPRTRNPRTSCPPGQLVLGPRVPLGQLVLGPCVPP